MYKALLRAFERGTVQFYVNVMKNGDFHTLTNMEFSNMLLPRATPLATTSDVREFQTHSVAAEVTSHKTIFL